MKLDRSLARKIAAFHDVVGDTRPRDRLDCREKLGRSELISPRIHASKIGSVVGSCGMPAIRLHAFA